MMRCCPAAAQALLLGRRRLACQHDDSDGAQWQSLNAAGPWRSSTASPVGAACCGRVSQAPNHLGAWLWYGGLQQAGSGARTGDFKAIPMQLSGLLWQACTHRPRAYARSMPTCTTYPAFEHPKIRHASAGRHRVHHPSRHAWQGQMHLGRGPCVRAPQAAHCIDCWHLTGQHAVDGHGRWHMNMHIYQPLYLARPARGTALPAHVPMNCTPRCRCPMAGVIAPQQGL